jgi:hypothetical protein
MMLEVTARWWLGAMLYLVLSVGTAAAIAVPQPEPEAACHEGVGEPLLLHYGEHTTGCAFESVTDLDRFTFEGTAGDIARLRLRTIGGTPDPRLELRGPDGMLVDTAACDGGCCSACSFSKQVILPQTGTYAIAISEGGADEGGSYILELDKTPPTVAPPLIPYDFPVTETINQPTDVDFLAFEGNANTQIRLTLRSTSGTPDPRMVIRDPSGAVMQTTPPTSCDGGCCSFCTFVVPITLTLSGTYLMEIFDGGLDEGGSYEISVECIFGECPGVPPPPECGNGTIDDGEACDPGLTPACCTPSCTLAPSGQLCRPATGACDASEACTGSSAECPTDGVLSAGTVCRAAVSPCDVAEACDGSSADCPTNLVAPSSVLCRTSAGICDVEEHCTGSSPTCPLDAFQPSSIECRPATSVCDAAEHCSGSGPACPADLMAPSSVVCRTSAGICDVEEHCTGSSPTCPPDAFQASSTECRPAASVCDVADHCSGSGPACPADLVAPPSVVCRASAGICDVEEHCTGSSTTCPPDAFQPSSTECRAAAGVCDVPEHCPGTGPACPADTVAPSTVVCRPAAGACDAPENCTGQSTACPPDAPQPDSTPCDDGQFCTVTDHCSGGACTGPPRVCDDGNTCTTDRCDEAVHQCTSVADGGACNDHNPCTDDACTGSGCTHTPAIGRACDDGLACTTGETCQANGSCGAGTPRTCAAAANTCAEAICDEATGGCTTRGVADGRTCDDGDPCTTGETCHDGTCTSGTTASCDDNNPCTTDRCTGAGQCAHDPVAEGATCDNGNTTTGDACRAGVCTDAACAGSAEGASCNDDNGCTDADVCRAGQCVPGAPPVCEVDLGGVCPPNAARCRIEAVCTPQRCRVEVVVRFQAPRKSKCRVVLRQVTTTQVASADLAGVAVTQAEGVGKILGTAKGRIGADGHLTLTPKLNRIGRKLLAGATNGVLDARAEATIHAPHESSARTELLPRLIELVRGSR